MVKKYWTFVGLSGLSLTLIQAITSVAATEAEQGAGQSVGTADKPALRSLDGSGLIERLQTLAKERRGQLPNEKREIADNVKYDEWTDPNRQRTVAVKIYMPKSGNAPFPVVIFSHGLGGSREAAAYLGQYLSEHGYVCVHIQHEGSDIGVINEGVSKGADAVFPTLKAAANGQNLILRAKDVSFIIDELQRRNAGDIILKGKLDLSKLAVAGHSFGAGTALAVSGQSYAFAPRPLADDRVKAAIYLSAPANMRGRNPSSVYGGIKIPGLLMTGTEDNSPIGDTKAEERRIPFDGIAAPHQYLINFTGGDHMIFGGTRFLRPNDEMFHSVISKTCLEFLDAYLKGDKPSQQWLDGKEGMTFISKAGQFERK